MNANPSTCPHQVMTYDGTFRLIRCMDCDTTWEADEPIPPTAQSRVVPASETKRATEHDELTTEHAIRELIDALNHHIQEFGYKDAGLSNEIWEKLADIERTVRPILNPDNEPTSEHMQHKDNDDDNITNS